MIDSAPVSWCDQACRKIVGSRREPQVREAFCVHFRERNREAVMRIVNLLSLLMDFS